MSSRSKGFGGWRRAPRSCSGDSPMIPVRGIGDLFDDPGEMLMLQLLHFSGQGLRRIARFYQYPRLKNGLTMII